MGKRMASSPRLALLNSPPRRRARNTCSSRLAQCPLQSQQETIIEVARIVDSILIQDGGVSVSAQISAAGASR